MSEENTDVTPEIEDFETWLAGGGRAQRTVRVYTKWNLHDELTRIEKLIEVADEDPDPSIGDVSSGELREEYREVLEALQASGRDFVVRALTEAETRFIASGIPDIEYTVRDAEGKEKKRWRVDQIAAGDALLAEALVSPKLDREQVKAMREQLGDGPTMTLYATAAELRTVGAELPSVPTWPGSSGSTRE